MTHNARRHGHVTEGEDWRSVAKVSEVLKKMFGFFALSLFTVCRTAAKVGLLDARL